MRIVFTNIANNVESKFDTVQYEEQRTAIK